MVPSSTAVSTFAWAAGASEPTSSRNSVPPSAASKRPTLAAFASVNAPALVPEELVLGERVRERGAVQVDEGLPRARAVAVQPAGEDAFPRAGLALDEHGRQSALEAALGCGDGVKLGAHPAQALPEENLVGVRPGLGPPVLGAPGGEPHAAAADEGERNLLGLERL
jgi:hypothetical protein